jgi:hypothetical protein
MSTNKIEIEDNEAQGEGGWRRRVLEAIRGIRYGSVEVVIHDARIVQIERREKVRFEETGGRRPDDRGGR